MQLTYYKAAMPPILAGLQNVSTGNEVTDE